MMSPLREQSTSQSKPVVYTKEMRKQRPVYDFEEHFPYPVKSYFGKRMLDIVLAMVGLVLLAPLMLAAALAVWLSSPGPIFYRGLRAGLRGRPFWQLKFRTMTVRHDGRPFTSATDARVTPVGRILRLLRVDELPQLVNILRGDMSWVGPRPEELSVVQRCYSREELRVLSVRPGLTGTVQVKYFPGLEYYIPPGVDPQEYYEKHLLPRRLKEDLDYVDKMSLALDLKVLAQTAFCILVKSWAILFNRTRVSHGESVAHTPEAKTVDTHSSEKSADTPRAKAA